MVFDINSNIRKAKTLSTDFYTDERYFEISKERIFARSWHFLGRGNDVDGLKPITLLPEFLDEPLLLSRTDKGIKCLSNVCTHRGKILVEGSCPNADLIRCGYHGRRFSLEGKFLSMPEFEGVEGFPSSSDDLAQIPLATRGGFVFASLAPVVSFNDLIADVEPRLQGVNIDGLKHTATRGYEINAHWALYCENYLEGFHIPYVHKRLNEVVDYGTYRTETFRYSSLQTAYENGGPRAVETPAAYYLFVFPNLMFNFYHWGISVNVVMPVTPTKTVVEFMTYVRDGASIEGGAGGDLHTVEMEDEAVVESVQRGIRSRFYTQGRYSPTREMGTHHFHRLIAEFME